MKILSVVVMFLLLCFAPLAAQEKLDIEYVKEKIHEMSTDGITITNIEFQDNNIVVNFTTDKNQHVSELMRQISESSLGSPSLFSLKKNPDSNGSSKIKGILYIK